MVGHAKDSVAHTARGKTRVLLAATQTLAEVAGANAEWFISDQRTAALVGTMIEPFAANGFQADDAPALKIFQRLLGAVAAAAVAHRELLPDAPGLQVFLGALADVKAAQGDDFVADLVTRAGFEKLVGRLIVRAADTPGLQPGTPMLREVLAAMLREAGENFSDLVDDPKLIGSVIEAGLAAAVDPAVELLSRKLVQQPLLAVGLKSLAGAIKTEAAGNTLFRQVANGEFLGTLYGAALRALAANPELLASTANVDAFLGKLLAALAGELADANLTNAFSVETLRALAASQVARLQYAGTRIQRLPVQ